MCGPYGFCGHVLCGFLLCLTLQRGRIVKKANEEHTRTAATVDSSCKQQSTNTLEMCEKSSKKTLT